MSVQPYIPEVRPVRTPVRKQRHYGVRAVSRPATAFTGDFYLAAEIDGALWFALGDFAGHGLRAALFMSLVQETLEQTIHACHSSDPAEVVAALDAALRDQLPLNRFATLVVGRARPDGRVDIVNAGHCPPVVVGGSGVRTVGSHGPVVGILPSATWRQETIHLARGERLFVYSDGILEAQNAAGEDFGAERVIARFAAFGTGSTIESLIDAAEEFSGGRLVDDATVLLVTRE